jgi:hypothetical protein
LEEVERKESIPSGIFFSRINIRHALFHRANEPDR